MSATKAECLAHCRVSRSTNMHRMNVNKRKSTKSFNKQQSRTKAINLKTPMRGGIRL